MESDTVTKKTKLLYAHSGRSSFDKLVDLYWGGTERRITGLTLRIIGINVLSVFILMLGALNFGQYETNIITNALNSFQTQARLITNTISVVRMDQPSALKDTLLKIRATTRDEIIILSDDDIIASTITPNNLLSHFDTAPLESGFITFDDIARIVTSLLPNRNNLPRFPMTSDGHANVIKASALRSSLMAWDIGNNNLILSAAFPIEKSDQNISVFIIRSGQTILNDIRYFWHQIFNLFLMTLALTILISIYLSGLIARPLRRLARAAENIRRNKTRAVEIPDFSDRYDEIGELSLVMRDLTESLWKRIDSIEQFAADVAHELKNPLTSLKSAVETLAISKKKTDKDKLLQILHHDIERMDRLITDISQASRLDAELSREQQQYLNLSTVLTKMVARYNSLYGQDYTIQLILPEDKDLYIQGVETRINQVFDNLLDNALSFSEKGGAVTISGFDNGQCVTVIVDDHGPGIPKSKLKTIFDRFYSQRRKEDLFGQHSGLGLAICKQIIDAMGGSIHAENKKNSTGARFIVQL